MKAIISSKVLEKLSKKIYHHCKSLQEQPITLEIIEDSGEYKFRLNSVEGDIAFDLHIHLEKDFRSNN